MDPSKYPAGQKADTVRLDGRFFAEQAAAALWAFFLPIGMIAAALRQTSRPFIPSGAPGPRARREPAE
jgi:hypothetical protein